MAAAKLLFVAMAIVAAFSAHTIMSRGLIADPNINDHWITGKHVNVEESTVMKPLRGKKLLDNDDMCPQEDATCVFGKHSFLTPDKCPNHGCSCVVGDYCTPNSDPIPIIEYDSEQNKE